MTALFFSITQLALLLITRPFVPVKLLNLKLGHNDVLKKHFGKMALQLAHIILLRNTE